MKKIAIIDDDIQSRNNLAFIVDDAGYEPEIITGKYGNDKKKLIDEIQSKNIFGVISDHRLSPGHLASFYGSELLASLYDLKVPSILITQFLDMDADVSIRKYRNKLPAVIGRGNQTPEIFDNLINLSYEEILNGPSATRKPHRALIRIEDFKNEDGEEVVDGIITNWNSNIAVRFPLELIPNNIRTKIHNTDICRLMAFVNTGASESKDLFITDIHLAPDIEDSDGLG
jgi:hypothetical protein